MIIIMNNIRKMNNWPNNRSINASLMWAVRNGDLRRTRELINRFELSHPQSWSEGYVYLCEALKNKHTAIAKLLLTSGSIVDRKYGNLDDTPLHLAVINDDIEILKMILDRGAETEAKNQYNETPLHLAAKEGCFQIVEDLVKYGACVNCVRTLRKNYTPLHFAVEKGHTEVVTLLLSSGANVDVEGEDSITPLHIAANNGNIRKYLRIAEILLNHGAFTNPSTLKERYTPLHFASELNNEEGVELFLNRGADVNARTKDNLTSLHIAIKRGREKSVKLLLQHGAKVDIQDKDGKTILQLAVEKGKLTIVEDVLKYCPDINDKRNRNSLKFAVQSHEEEYREIVEALLEYGISINPGDTNNPMLFHTAVEKGYSKIVEDLLKYGADVHTLNHSTFKKGFTPLHSAAESKQEEVANLLISYEADVNAQDKNGKTPIFYAIENANSKITRLLLTNGANVKDSPELLNIAVKTECIENIEALLQHIDINSSDEYGRTALHFTAQSGDEDIFRAFKKNRDIDIKGKIARLLLIKGVNVDAQTKKGVTPLHAAINGGHVKVVEALLEYNANLNPGEKKITPLHLSAQRKNGEICRMLLNKGANVNDKQKDGSTALHIAARKGHKEVVKVLLECGAKVDSKMENNITPLHLAAGEGYQEIIEIILKFGADIDSRDADGRTALHIASQKGYNKVVATFLENGSDIDITCRKNYTPLHYAMSRIRSSYAQSHYNDFNHDYNCDARRAACTYEVFKRHILKMKTANLYVSRKNLLSMRDSGEMNDFQDECEEEIAIMKSEKINNLTISFYDILTKDTNSLAMYMKNECVVQVFKSDDYKTKFSIYASMIENQFRKGLKKKELLEQGNRIFHILFNNLPKLPYDCVEKIIIYLSDKDLRNLIDACKPLDISNPNNNVNYAMIPSSSSQVQYVQVKEE